jgi:hypothetical protein
MSRPSLLRDISLLASVWLIFVGVARCGELTPEQRAFILGNPKSVVVEKPASMIRMEGADYRGYYKCPYLHVYINGKGPFTVLFDTGAAYNILSSKVIKEAGVAVYLDRGGHRDLMRVQDMKIGDVEITDLPAVRDDDFGVDAVVGFRTFGDMNILFKLAKRQLLVSAEPIPLEGSFEVPYKLTSNLPTIPLMVGDAAIPTLIDTGDDAYPWEARTEDLRGARFAHPPAAAGSVLNGANVQQTLVSTLADDSTVRFGPVSIRNAAVGINDSLPVPDFGVDYLQEFNFEFIPKRMVVLFQPLTAGSGTKLMGRPSVGFTPEFAGKDTVHSVVPHSAAEQAGMRPGNRIVSIGGLRANTYDPRTWDALLSSGKPITVTWFHDKKRRTDRFAVTLMQ